MATPFPFVSGAVLTADQMNAITTLPINNQTASYTLLAGDAGKRVIMNVGSANTVTVNNNVFAAGDTIFIANKGEGVSTITEGSGVTINSASGLALVTSQSGTLIALSASSFLFVASDVTAASSGVVQVKSTTKSDTFTTTSTSFTDITGLSVTVTPTSASNKILVVAFANVAANSGVTEGMLVLLRDSTEICIGNAEGNRDQASSNFATNTVSMVPTTITFLDSPATTSAVTYKLQIRATIAAQSVFVNRTVNDGNSAAVPRVASTITVFEVTP